MFGQVIRSSFLCLVTIWAVLTIGIIGCGGDDDDWVGTWSLETVDGQSWKEALGDEGTITTNNWIYNADGTWEAEVGFELKEDGTSITASVQVMGLYFLLPDSRYRRTIEGDAGGFFEGIEDDTGTWSRAGNTLTLFSDDDTIFVFKKK